MQILITGCAGFIGFHLTRHLLKNTEFDIIGIDNVNAYYDIGLKEERIKILKEDSTQLNHPFQFHKIDICDNSALEELANKFSFNAIIHLAAQAGVRYSIENPDQYISSNINGFYNILELCRHKKISKLFFASSSSVYGNNPAVPYNENQKTDSPISLYAATKKSNEAMAFAYHQLYNIKTIGLRFFTVYGPWGRPDMAYFSFTDAIYKQLPIKVFNKGKLKRDFTFIGDVALSIHELLKIYINKNDNRGEYEIFNIGNSQPVVVTDFITILEELVGKKAIIEFLPMQQGDVTETYADVAKLYTLTGYKPNTDLKAGLSQFVNWYLKKYANESVG